MDKYECISSVDMKQSLVYWLEESSLREHAREVPSSIPGGRNNIFQIPRELNRLDRKWPV